MATFSQAPLPFSGSGGPWEARPDWGAPAVAVAATPLYLAQPASGLEQYGYTAPAAPAAGAAVFHTTETLALESPPSAGPNANGWGELTNVMIAPSSQQWGGPAALSQSMPPHYTQQQLEQQNADLARQCHELQERLEAAAAVGSTSASAASTELEASHPPLPNGAHRRSSPRQPGQRSTLPQSSLGDEPDREEVEALKRRLAAKEREAEAAAAAAAAKHAQAAAREAELEQERWRAAELADEVARWKDECAQREREMRMLQQRLEATASHAGLLEDGGAALRRKSAELGTALAQRDVTIRQLEERLRSLQGSEGSRERQLDALQSGGEALRRENGTLRQQVAALEGDKQRLEEALRIARTQVSALQCRNAELAAEAARAAAAAAGAAAAPVLDLRSNGSAAHANGSGARHEPGAQPTFNPSPEHKRQDGAEPGWAPATRQAMPSAAPAHYHGMSAPHPEQQLLHDPRNSLQYPVNAHEASWQQARQRLDSQQRPHTAAGAPALHSQGAPTRSALQQYNQHAPTPGDPAAAWFSGSVDMAGQPASAPAADASDTCSVSSYAASARGPWPQPWQLQNDYGSSSVTSAMHPAPPAPRQGALQQLPPQAGVAPAGSPLPWQLQNDYGSSCMTHNRHAGPPSVGEPAQWQHLPAATRTSSEGGSARSDVGTDATGARLGALSVGGGTPGPAGSPFATEVTLQDMLARTQALEDRLLALNAERNELQAESARMPSHTTGRTLQERKRRAEVERRLEELNRECSSVRLQLRRLGVK
ncbi:hypothetical protein ABPG77_007984 [Micractinium sp. CCAP 211/92]